MIAPEQKLTACAQVLRRAILTARLLALGPGHREQVADLMDAVHNIPELVLQWERCDEVLLVAQLEAYDEARGGDLRATYDGHDRV